MTRPWITLEELRADLRRFIAWERGLLRLIERLPLCKLCGFHVVQFPGHDHCEECSREVGHG